MIPLRVIELTDEQKSNPLYYMGYGMEAGDCYVCGWPLHVIEGRAKCWAIRLPGVGGMFHTNTPATDASGFWTITGEPPNLTVTPSINVGPEQWHGFITNGQMTPDTDSGGRRDRRHDEEKMVDEFHAKTRPEADQ